MVYLQIFNYCFDFFRYATIFGMKTAELLAVRESFKSVLG